MGKPVGDDVADDYLAKRTLKKGSAGWILLAGLGVSYVISGDYAGWNNGLAVGGFGGLLIAFVLMGIMYLCMVLGMAELSSTMPSAGGGYTFARSTMGTWGGYITGVAVLLEYTLAAAAISTFIGGYVGGLGFFDPSNKFILWAIAAVVYLIFCSILLLGAGDALKTMFIITVIALIGLVIFVVVAIPLFNWNNLFDIPVTDAVGASTWLPFGAIGVWTALPFGIWFFLAIEGVPLAAEEADDPKRDVPRGIIIAMLILIVSGALVLFLAPGAGGAAEMGLSANPLVEALHHGVWATVINYIALAGLIASFFSIMYAYSRQIFALSRAGYLPRALSVVNHRKSPVLALIVPSLIGLILATIFITTGARLLNMAVFGAAVSYVMINLSHIIFRIRDPHMERPYRTPGGIVTTSIALVLSVAAVIATFLYDAVAATSTFGVLMLFVVYFAVYSRHHLVAKSPDEEFAALAEAEAELR